MDPDSSMGMTLSQSAPRTIRVALRMDSVDMQEAGRNFVTRRRAAIEESRRHDEARREIERWSDERDARERVAMV